MHGSYEIVLLYTYIFSSCVNVIISDDCPPCTCEIYYFPKIDCFNETDPLTSIPRINFTKPVNWETIYLTQQSLKELPANAFESVGLVYLDTIIINYCEVSRIDDDAFINVTDLNDLDLSFNDLPGLSNDVFKHTKYIKYIKLNYNKIQHISDKIFATLSRLENLELGSNFITVFHGNALLNNKRLKQLHLQNNNLTTLNIDVIKTINTFTIMRTAGNPFICDCLIRDLHNFMVNKFRRDKTNYEKQLSGTTCIAPKNLRGESWRKLIDEDFSCWLTSQAAKKKVKAKIEKTVKLSCTVDTNTIPSISWFFGDNLINITSKKYRSNMTRNNYTQYKFSLDIFDLIKKDQGTYRCNFRLEDQNLTSENEIQLILHKEPLSAASITIIVGIILFAFCAVALVIKCIIKISIAVNSSRCQPNFEESFTYANLSFKSREIINNKRTNSRA